MCLRSEFYSHSPLRSFSTFVCLVLVKRDFLVADSAINAFRYILLQTTERCIRKLQNIKKSSDSNAMGRTLTFEWVSC